MSVIEQLIRLYQDTGMPICDLIDFEYPNLDTTTKLTILDTVERYMTYERCDI